MKNDLKSRFDMIDAHLGIIKEVGESLGILVTYPIIRTVNGNTGGFALPHLEIYDPRLKEFSPWVKFPRILEDNEKATIGFYAHEISHICLWDDPEQKDYLEKLQKWAYPNLLTLMPYSFNFRFRLKPLSRIVECKVDAFAEDNGYQDEIAELRNYFPLV